MGKTRMSSVAFAAAFVVVVVGMFLALGGWAYAAGPSSAVDQYGPKVVDVTPDDSGPTVVADATVVSDSAGTADTGLTAQTLPNTGFSLLAAAVLGSGLVALGVALRRREAMANDAEPFFQFCWGRSVHWFRTSRIAGQVRVRTKFFSFSIGSSWPKDAGLVRINGRRTGEKRGADN
jgi:LPXTG-motif cell wall-anchored protein